MTKPVTNLPDTNVIIRYLTRDAEALYGRAKAFFDEVKDGRAKAIILESVIAESIYVLTKMYAVPRDRAARRLIDILRYKGIANVDQKALIQVADTAVVIARSRTIRSRRGGYGRDDGQTGPPGRRGLAGLWPRAENGPGSLSRPLLLAAHRQQHREGAAHVRGALHPDQTAQ